MSNPSKLLRLIAVGIFLMLSACRPTPPPIPSSASIPPLTSIRALALSPTPPAAAGSISGRVTRSDGKTPISAAGILANGIGSGDLKTTLTQKDGTYILDKLVPDTYKVDVILPGYEDGTRDEIKVAADQRVVEVDFALRVESTISGKVTQADGITPIVDASVLASGPNGEPSAAVTAKDGTYTVLGLLTPGVYQVDVFKEGVGFVSKKVTLPEAGGVIQEINFSSFGGAILGQITRFDDGTPVAGATITAMIDLESEVEFEFQNLIATTQTGSDGRYRLESLQPLPYALQVNSPGYGTEARSVQISQEAKIMEINLSLKSGGSISGRVTELDGITARNGSILNVFDSNNHLIHSASEIVTAPNGEYKIVDLSAGSYTILCSISDSVSMIQSNVEVVAGRDTQSVDFRPEKAVGSISGKIIQADGVTPIPQAIILIVSDTVAGSTESDGDGIYRVDGLPAGVYTILIAISGYESETRDGITITASETTGGIDFRMKPQ